MWRTKLPTTRNGYGQSEWSPIGCEACMRENRVVPYRLCFFLHKSDIPSPLPTSLVFR